MRELRTIHSCVVIEIVSIFSFKLLRRYGVLYIPFVGTKVHNLIVLQIRSRINDKRSEYFL